MKNYLINTIKNNQNFLPGIVLYTIVIVVLGFIFILNVA